MASNTLLTIDMITREALRLAHEKATFIGSINRQFDSSWSSEGATGNTLRIRVPSQYTRTQGSRVMSVQDSLQQSTSIVVATQDHVDMRFNSAELSQSLDNFTRLHLEPAMAALISGIESDVLQGCTKLTYNFAGTANTPISSLTVPGAARARLNQSLAPKDNARSIHMNSPMMGALVTGVAAYFNPSGAVSEQYREGMIARTSMADYYENERIWAMPNTADVAGGLDGYTIIDGDADLTVSSFATPVAGMVFTIGTGTTGVFDCHPETKAPYSQLKQFVILSGSTATNLLISPTIYITGARQNVSGASAALQVSSCSGAVFTCLGDASSTYPQALMCHRDSFTFATAELPLMADASKCVRKTLDGLSVRVWQASDIRNDEQLTRIDMLYGYAAIRPQWACRMIGTV
jgi:hypothetical protein